ncbi:MAG: nucleotidyltransferase family protein [Actinomycetes bacterium]
MTESRTIAGLVLAAGEGKRFGGLKQLERLGPRLLMEYAVESMLDVDLIERVAVTLGAGADEIARTADLEGAEVVIVADWREGVAASLRAGFAELAEAADAIVVVPADRPLISAPMITRVIEAWDGTAPAVQATHNGAHGYPLLLASGLRAAVAGLAGEDDATSIPGVGDLLIECGPNVLFDVDLAEDLEELRDSAVGGATE